EPVPRGLPARERRDPRQRLPAAALPGPDRVPRGGPPGRSPSLGRPAPRRRRPGRRAGHDGRPRVRPVRPRPVVRPRPALAAAGDLRDRDRPRRRPAPRPQPVRPAGDRARAGALEPLRGGAPLRRAAGPDDPAVHRAGRRRGLRAGDRQRGGAGREPALLPRLRARLRLALGRAAAGRAADAARHHPPAGGGLAGAGPPGRRVAARHRRLRHLGRRAPEPRAL
ncbi:MAG: hypothetical protein AVDCRST_MAG59-2371, partial [uncultured Thermomicrobiales bacterium]